MKYITVNVNPKHWEKLLNSNKNEQKEKRKKINKVPQLQIVAAKNSTNDKKNVDHQFGKK